MMAAAKEDGAEISALKSTLATLDRCAMIFQVCQLSLVESKARPLASVYAHRSSGSSVSRRFAHTLHELLGNPISATVVARQSILSPLASALGINCLLATFLFATP